MANEMLNEIWELEGYPEGGEGWFPVRYADGRPVAGVLATNGLWWKYTTTAFNQNRSRAAAVSRLLLCEDLLNRPVEFEVSEDLLESEDVSSMVRSEPGCLACHSIIEPLADALEEVLGVLGPRRWCARWCRRRPGRAATACTGAARRCAAPSPCRRSERRPSTFSNAAAHRRAHVRRATCGIHPLRTRSKSRSVRRQYRHRQTSCRLKHCARLRCFHPARRDGGRCSCSRIHRSA